MKTIFAVLALAALGGCAVQQPYYANRAPAVVDPYQWHTVSVEPSSRVAGGPATTTYTTEAVPVSQPTTAYASQPVYYVTQPQPVYYAPAPAYYYPPVSIGLDFVVGGWCCHRWGGRGYYHR